MFPFNPSLDVSRSNLWCLHSRASSSLVHLLAVTTRLVPQGGVSFRVIPESWLCHLVSCLCLVICMFDCLVFVDPRSSLYGGVASWNRWLLGPRTLRKSS